MWKVWIMLRENYCCKKKPNKIKIVNVSGV